jgi:hypothetical protein
MSTFRSRPPTENRVDEWGAIKVLRDVRLWTIGTFETTFEDEDIRMLYYSNNGLDGKVSRLDVASATALPGILSFFEGNDGTQNKVCDLQVTNQAVQFKSHAACENDETCSLVLSLISAETTIEVFDNPDCRPNDDWTEIIVKRAVLRVSWGPMSDRLKTTTC